MPAEDHKTPIDTLVELGLYAPLGLALAARDSLPDLIARGRQQVTSQVALARMMGKYAVSEGEKDLRKRVEEVSSTLSALGLLPEPHPSVRDPHVPAGPSNDGASNGSTNGKASAPAAAEPVLSRADLAIPGYDTLSASQVVQRLAGLTTEELEAVRDYESGTRGRRTILSKIGQLQTGPST
ncbi:MAG TPA: hypothetical protein VM143_07500 [Acidimicrobiales bacterium]|nr:hypothetical protein [Acidimicrobiales bacterium]